MELVDKLFGHSLALYGPVRGLERRWDGTRYSFMSDEDYVELHQRGLPGAMKVYWYEILARAHMAATTSIIRSTRWIDGVSLGLNGGNLFATAACLRGLLEAAADSLDGLLGIAETLAEHHAAIQEALNGRQLNELSSKEIEDQLIHFLYGRRLEKGEKAPKTHERKTASEYNKLLERARIPRIIDLYSYLCQLTHPAAHSVLTMFQEEDDNSFFLTAQFDRNAIVGIANDFQEPLFSLPIFALNPGAVTLAVLNYFTAPEFHTPELFSWPTLLEIPGWQKALVHLRGVPPCCSTFPN